ncbi:outer membrane beta-barrel protein [Akkermansiaceae bacterium]|nr:outer membrane beta-barrel protein [Akkermansiaceae bacterium]
MKKNILTGSIILASMGVASAQGLYDIAPSFTEKESSPIKWTAGLSVGVDDNVSPSTLFAEDDSIGFLNAFVTASLRSITPQTTWDAYATVGGRLYFDEPVGSGDDLIPQFSIGLNASHQVNERLRLVSSNSAAYQSEPDFENGFAGNSQTGDYLSYNTTNSVGYRWSERLGTFTGFGINGLDFNQGDLNDRVSYSLFHNFRYNLNEQTILTAGYRYRHSRNRGFAGDADSHIITAGVERRLNQSTVFSVKAGVQVRDVDGGASNTSPYVEAALRSQVNEQFSIRSFLRLSQEEFGTTLSLVNLGQGFTNFNNATYDENRTLRIGVDAEYRVSRPLTLLAGFDFVNTEYSDGRSRRSFIDGSTLLLPDEDQNVYNLFVGFSYEVSQDIFFTGTYNYTTSDSDLGGRDYDRNRASLGVRVTF